MNPAVISGLRNRWAVVAGQFAVCSISILIPRLFKSPIATRSWMRALASCLAAIILSTVPPCGTFAATQKGAPPASEEGATTPAKIHELLNLLADPKVQEWLEKQGEAKSAAGTAPETVTHSVSHYFDARVGAVREHIVALTAAVPDLPNQFKRAAGLVSADLGDRGRVKVLLLLAVFVGLGFGVEWLFRKATEGMRRRLDEHPLETVNDRLRVIATRFAFAVGLVAAFALGSIGAFLALDWPPFLREMVFAYLVVFLAIRVAVIVGHFLLAPDHERFRIVPMDTLAARFWWRRLAAFVGWFAFGWVEVGLLTTLGLSLEGHELVAYALGLGLMAIALEAVWRRPVAPQENAEEVLSETHHPGRGARNALLSIGIVLLWVLWVLRAMPSFWFVLVIIVLPLAIAVTRRAIGHLLRPPSSQVGEDTPSVTAAWLERGVRGLLIIGAAGVLAWGWGIDVVTLTGQDTLVARLAHGVLSAVVILLAADVLWHAMKAAIDRKLAEAADLGQPNTDEARRRARLRTLLPIFRNILFVVVIAVAALMALAAMGVEIGPFIAGMFYLLDDAFRVGEYIQSGNYKGTVEGFSIRSIKLRHHRGPVYTVPFSLLGA